MPEYDECKGAMPERRSPLIESLYGTDETIDRLQKLIEQLETRLGPVTAPMPEGLVSPDDPPRAAVSDVVEHVQRHARRVAAACHRIENFSAALDV